MNSYLYSISDGQFSYEFNAPLMVKKGEKLIIYCYSKDLKKYDEFEYDVAYIDHDKEIVHCSGHTE
jgi:hypothetical protein